MDKIERERLITYYELKKDITAKISIAEELRRVYKSINDWSLVTFTNGTIQAYESMLTTVQSKIDRIRGIKNEDKIY